MPKLVLLCSSSRLTLGYHSEILLQLPRLTFSKMKRGHSSSAVNGHIRKSRHKNKHKEKEYRYILDANDNPKAVPVPVGKQYCPEHCSPSHVGKTMKRGHSSSALNGHFQKSRHKNKHKEREFRYILDVNGNPKAVPVGRRLKITKQYRPEHCSPSHVGKTMKRGHSSSALNGHFQKSRHKNKHKEREFRYILDVNGNPKAVPVGRRLKITKQYRPEHCSPSRVGKLARGKKRKAEENYVRNGKKVKTETDYESPAKKRKKEVKWKWWEEKRVLAEGAKWRKLEHKGPVFAPPYKPLPSSVHFKYGGKLMKLKEATEEVMTLYAKMLDHPYTSKATFNKNFFHDWRKVMTESERSTITDLRRCDFRAVHAYFQDKAEEKKQRSQKEKEKEKQEREMMQEKYGFCLWDGHREKVGNFCLEPPSLFRGRGVHPKMGKIKKRIQPEDIIINCSKGSKIPRPTAGHRWKEVRHDNAVTWLVSWTDNIQGLNKYIMLSVNSRIKGEKDWQKYEKARELKTRIEKIRKDYWRDMKSTDMAVRQRAVALFFIDKLALRAGNEKEADESADTVGCCSLRCEHIKTHKVLGKQNHVIVFDFLGKDSIRYYNKVPVPKQVFKNVNSFMQNKMGEDDLFDTLTTCLLNKYLDSLMDGLSAKVFRTCNASITLQQQLDDLTDPDDSQADKMLSYNRSNRAVAILCNHHRAAPKNFGEQMQRARERIQKKQDVIADAKRELKGTKSDYKCNKTQSKKRKYAAKKNKVERLQEQLAKLEVQATDREENKEISLGTSKLNYLDPRITAAWCKRWDVPIEKVYNKTQRDKFAWAIAMVDEDFEF